LSVGPDTEKCCGTDRRSHRDRAGWRTYLSISCIERHYGKCDILYRKTFIKLSEEGQCYWTNNRSGNNFMSIFLKPAED